MVSARNPSLDDLIAEYLDRLDSGEKLNAEEFVANWPKHRQQFLAFVSHASAFQAVLASESDALSGTTPELGGSHRIAKPRGKLAGCRLGRRLGRGGMATVYEAFPDDGGPPVALKLLNFDIEGNASHQRRFRREAQAVRTIDHPSIVPLDEAGIDRETSYLKMQLIDGVTLSDVVVSFNQEDRIADHGDPGSAASDEARTPLTGHTPKGCFGHACKEGEGYFVTIARLFASAAEALQAAHHAGVVHRDIKPSNLLLDANGKLWLTDFGLSSLEESHTVLTQTGDLLGTPKYMSPEQALGVDQQLDHRTDIYSLGATLYELVALRPAYSGNRIQILSSLADHRFQPPGELNSDVPRQLEAIILKAMAHSPSDRYATAKDFADDLRNFVEGRPTHARHPTTVDRLAAWTVKNPQKALTTIVCCVLVASLFGAIQHLNNRRLETLNDELTAANESLENRSDQLSNANLKMAEQETTLRRHLYAADVSAAYDSYNRMQVQHASRLLQQQVPAEGMADLRGLEWWLLNTLTAPLPSKALMRHEGEARAVAVLPQTGEILSAGHDGCVRKWCPQARKQVAVFEIGGELDSIAVSPDGKSFAVGKNIADGTNPLTIRSCDDGSVIQHLTGHDYSIEALAFSPDGKLLASGGRYSDIIIHALETGKPVHRIESGSRNESVTFSASGSYFAGVVRDQHHPGHPQSVRTLDPNTGKPFTEINYGYHANVLADFADGQSLLCAGSDQLHIYDLQTGENLVEIVDLVGRIRDVAVSPDDSWVAAVTDSGQLYLWQIPGDLHEGTGIGEPHVSSIGTARLTEVHFADANSVVVTSENGNIYQVDFIRHHSHQALSDLRGLHFDGELLFDELYLMNRSDELVKVSPSSMERQLIAQLPRSDFRRIGIRRRRNEAILASSKEVLVLDLHDGTPIAEIQIDVRGESVCRRVILSPTEDRLYLIHTDRLRVFETRDWTLVQDLTIPLFDGALSPDGRQLILTSRNELHVLDAQSLQNQRTIQFEGSMIFRVEFSQTGRYVALGRADGSFDIREGASLETIAVFEGHQTAVNSVVFYDHDRRVASMGVSGTEIVFWDIETKRMIGKLAFDELHGYEPMVSQDGAWIAAINPEAPPMLWNTSATVLRSP